MYYFFLTAYIKLKKWYIIKKQTVELESLVSRSYSYCASGNSDGKPFPARVDGKKTYFDYGGKRRRII
jgi:hypothetical protein